MRAISTKPLIITICLVSLLAIVLTVTINIRSDKVVSAAKTNDTSPFSANVPQISPPRNSVVKPANVVNDIETDTATRSAQPPSQTKPRQVSYQQDSPQQENLQPFNNQKTQEGRFSLEMQAELSDKQKPRTQAEQAVDDSPNALLRDYLKIATQQFQTANSTLANQETTDTNPTQAQQNFIENNSDNEFYLNASLDEVRSEYEVKTGTFIPALLITGINSDLPGYVTAQVSAPVYDTVSGRYLLIPQGSRLFGTFDSGVFYGQKRVLVVWTRLTLPDGASISLQAMGATDGQGYSGLSDLYDDHFLQSVGAALLLSMVGGTATAASQSFEKSLGTSEGSRILDETSQSFVEQLASISGEILRKSLYVKPTIIIRPGKRINVLVNKDMILKPYES